MMLLSKKGGVQSLIARVALIVVILLVLIIIVLNVKGIISGSDDEAVCAASIQAHMAFADAMMKAEETMKTETPFMALFTNMENEPPPIKCDTKLIKSKAKNAEEAEKELLSSVDQVWKIFNKGNSILFPDDMNQKSFCFIYDVYQFNKNYDINFSSAILSYPVEDYLFKFTPNDAMKEREYKISSSNPNYKLNFFHYMPDLNNNEHIIAKLPPSYDLEKMFYYGQLYYTGSANTSKSASDYKLYFAPTVKGDFFSIISFGLNYESTNMQSFMLNYMNSFKNMDIEKIQNTYLNKDNIKPYYAVLFHQYHYSAPDDFLNKVKNYLFYFFNKKDEMPNYFIFSSIMIVPYTSDVMSQLSCEYMPVQFEN